MAHPRKILSTRPLTELLLREAALEGIVIKEMSFIETSPVDSIEIHEEIVNALEKEATVVFTSMNAVEAVGFHVQEDPPEWSIYCMGNATLSLVKEYFGEEHIIGTGTDAADLAEKIIDDGYTDEIIFFCGDQRRDELPERLREEDIDVDEIVVYETRSLPVKLEEDFDGILFFSPSAVSSFFKFNAVPETTILFAIGKTTAAEIRKHCKNRIRTAKESAKEDMVMEVIDFFAEK